MNRLESVDYFLNCYAIMQLVMVVFFAIALLATLMAPDLIPFISFESRIKGFIMVVFAPAMISLAFTVFHFERRVTA